TGQSPPRGWTVATAPLLLHRPPDYLTLLCRVCGWGRGGGSGAPAAVAHASRTASAAATPVAGASTTHVAPNRRAFAPHYAPPGAPCPSDRFGTSPRVDSSARRSTVSRTRSVGCPDAGTAAMISRRRPLWAPAEMSERRWHSRRRPIRRWAPSG